MANRRPAVASLFELDAPGAASPNAPAQRAAGHNALFELELPSAPSPLTKPRATAAAAAAPDAEEPERTGRSTMEFLFELEAPSRSTSRTIDFDAESEAEAGPDTAGTGFEPTAFAVGQAPLRSALPDLRLLQPEADAGRASSADGSQARAHRAVTRIAACRDALRLMGKLGVPDAERAAAARMLLDLDGLVGLPDGALNVVKDPESALKNATSEQLAAIEAAVSSVEDKLLWLDESITLEAFRTRVESAKQAKKLLGRYARLLASRRFMAGPRRDRFEWIVTRLLVVTDDQGMQHVVPPERARPVLQYVLGDTPRKAKPEELAEAIAYLQDALVRLEAIDSHDDFFDGGFFLDMHGYKVSMRELLAAPEFVYLSVLINANVHNRIEKWIADRERLLRTHVATAGSPRDDILRQLREQESAVDDIFAIKRRPVVLTATHDAEKAVDAPTKPKPRRKAKKQRFQFELIAFDRQLVLQILAFLAVIASISAALVQTDIVGAPKVVPLSDNEVAELSPMLAGGWINGSGDKAFLDGLLRPGAWTEVEPRERTKQVEHLAATLAARGIQNAVISDYSGNKIAEIHGSLAAFVQGGRL